MPLTKNMGAAITGTLNEESAFISMLTDIKFQREGLRSTDGMFQLEKSSANRS